MHLKGPWYKQLPSLNIYSKFRKSMIRQFSTAFVFSLLYNLLHAQPPAMDTITISSSLAPQSINHTGRNIQVINGDMFNQLPVHSIDELMRYVPGVEIQMRGPAGAQSDIVLRGGTFQQVLVILDGSRLNDPNTGHFNSYIPIAPSEIDRIEILKGAASSIYGSEAVGGVINIITKSFASQTSRSQELSASAATGEYGFVNTNIGGYYSNGQTCVSGGFLSNNATGQPQRGTKGNFNNNTLSFSMQLRFNPNWRLALRSSYDARKFGAQNFYTTFLSDTAAETVKTSWNQLRLQYQKNTSDVELNAGYKWVADHYIYNPSSTANQNKSQLFQLLTIYRQSINQNASLVSGVQYISKMIRSNDRGDHNENQVAGFLSYIHQLRALTINPSLRLDYTSPRGSEWLPQLNLSYSWRQFQFRASGGKTVRDADFTEQYNNYNKTFVSGGRIGNPLLVPERSLSYEAGMDYMANSFFRLSASFFQRYHTRLIDYVPTPYADMPRKINLSPTGSYALASNLYDLTTTGSELDVNYSKSIRSRQNLSASLGFIWLRSHSDSAVTSFYINSHATYLVNSTVIYSFNQFSLSLSGVYKDRMPQSAPGMKQIPAKCFMMNSKLEYGFNKKSIGLFMQVDNVFDETCSDLLGAQLPGRWLTGGIKWSLK
jgi:iron complex outermembrane receptor protein